MVRATLLKARTHARDSQSVKNRSARRAALAARGGGNDIFDPDRWRRDAVDGVGAVHCRMEADYGCAAAVVGDRMAGRVREIPDDPAIPGAPPRHEPGRFQGHLLVGVVASPAGTPDRRCFSSALPVFPL